MVHLLSKVFFALPPYSAIVKEQSFRFENFIIYPCCVTDDKPMTHIGSDGYVYFSKNLANLVFNILAKSIFFYFIYIFQINHNSDE